jgi:hypothetical protein
MNCRSKTQRLELTALQLRQLDELPQQDPDLRLCLQQQELEAGLSDGGIGAIIIVRFTSAFVVVCFRGHEPGLEEKVRHPELRPHLQPIECRGHGIPIELLDV